MIPFESGNYDDRSGLEQLYEFMYSRMQEVLRGGTILFTANKGKVKRARVVEDTVTHFEGRYGWSRIKHYNKNWVRDTLNKVATRVKYNHDRRVKIDRSRDEGVLEPQIPSSGLTVATCQAPRQSPVAPFPQNASSHILSQSPS
jgi:hypothetical protein